MPAALVPSPRSALRLASLASLLMCAAAQAQDLPGQQAPTAVSAQAGTLAAVEKSERTFLMSAFMATSQNTLSLFSSADGINFTSLGSEVYTPAKQLLRDPSIIRAADGLYYLSLIHI